MSTFTVRNTEVVSNSPRDLGPYEAEMAAELAERVCQRSFRIERTGQELFSSIFSSLYRKPPVWQVECPICGRQFSSTEMPQWAPLNPYEVVQEADGLFLVTCGEHSLYDVWEQRSRTSRRRYREPAFIPKRRRRR